MTSTDPKVYAETMNRCIDCEKESIDLICKDCKRIRLRKLEDAYDRILEDMENPKDNNSVPA